jgi:hypothetical protein
VDECLGMLMKESCWVVEKKALEFDLVGVHEEHY